MGCNQVVVEKMIYGLLHLNIVMQTLLETTKKMEVC